MNPKQWKLQHIFGALKEASDNSVTMRIRLFVFMIALVATMVLGVGIILLMTGSLTVGMDELSRLVRKELSALSHNMTVQCGDTSVQLVHLSESLARSIETHLLDRNIRVSDLQVYPEVLEDIIGGELSRLQLALEKTKCSGVFMVLDVTVNPTLPNAEHSRAGLYIRNSEPNVISPDTTRLYLRGFPKIALKNGLSLQSKWDMEFNVENFSFYHLPMEKYNETKLPLSRLYYWNLEEAIPGLGENVLLCSAPLIDSEGNTFGVCGFEISAMNFKLNYAPDDSEYRHTFCMLSPMDDTGLYPNKALLSGNHTEFSYKQDKGPLAYFSRNGLNIYKSESGTALVGLHESIKLYPDDSAFADQRFAMSLFISKEEMDAVISKANMQLILICAVLLLLGIGVSLFISKRYLNPIMTAFDTIRSYNLDKVAKTNILEIDQLIELIRALHTKENQNPDDLFEDFIGRVKTLTRTEAKIFRYYLEGKSGSDILSLMFISTNTLKTHNKHIYNKLGVSSRDEMMLYIELINRSGLTAEII